jgi:hypothetical protein
MNKCAIILLFVFFGNPAFCDDCSKFHDLGIAADVAEIRNLIACTNSSGKKYIICNAADRGKTAYLIVTDVDAGKTFQSFNPPEVKRVSSFGGVMTKKGKYYYSQGPNLLMFDLDKISWTNLGIADPDTSDYLVFIEDNNGTVWCGGTYMTDLVSISPDGKIKKHGRMDPGEKYLNYLACDDKGWIYGGVGTAKASLVAYNPVTGEKKQMLDEKDRTLGSGYVYSASDGSAVGGCKKQRFRLYDGKKEEITDLKKYPKKEGGNLKYGSRKRYFPDGSKIARYDVYKKEIEISGPDDKIKKMPLTYSAAGPKVTSVALGPNGMLYASTAHPMHLVACDPLKGSVNDMGPVPAVGGGNFCAMVNGSGKLYGCDYAHGGLWEYDPGKPWNPPTTKIWKKDYSKDEKALLADCNPRLLAQWKYWITRPRAILFHPDKEHVLMSGYGDYGVSGGGMGVYNIKTGQTEIYSADKHMLKGQSCICMKALPSGDIVGGTSIQTPGGGHQQAKASEIFVFDWNKKNLVFNESPYNDEVNVMAVELAKGLAFFIMEDGRLFVFDPQAKKIIYKSDAKLGGVVRSGLVKDKEDNLYAILEKGLFKINTSDFSVSQCGKFEQPATAGGVLIDDKVFFASLSRLCNYDLR